MAHIPFVGVVHIVPIADITAYRHAPMFDFGKGQSLLVPIL